MLSPYWQQKTRAIFDSRAEWPHRSMIELQHAVADLIDCRRTLRKQERGGEPLSATDVEFMQESGRYIPVIFEIQAAK